MPNLPNFFILGAPKCGTTALALYLAEHPSVFFSPLKEPYYFNTDMEQRNIYTLAEYTELFDDARPTHVCIGEGSSLYLYSCVAARNIAQTVGQAKFIVLLRDPVDMLASWHAHLVRNGQEDQVVFEDAWKLVEARRARQALPRRCRDRQLLDYERIARFGQQIERLFKHVDRKDVLILFQEDMLRSPASVYAKTQRFLDLPSHRRDRFPLVNQHRTYRSVVLQRLLAAVPTSAVRSMSGKKYGTGLLSPLHKINCRTVPRRPLAAETRKQLRQHFLPDILKLEELLRTKLCQWKLV